MRSPQDEQSGNDGNSSQIQTRIKVKTTWAGETVNIGKTNGGQPTAVNNFRLQEQKKSKENQNVDF